MNKKNTNTIILDATQIKQKTKRIAYQILEDHLNEEELVLVGIQKSGYAFAQDLMNQLHAISDLKITLGSLRINKKNPIDAVESSLLLSNLKQKSVVIVDDVLNSGATLIYAVKFFLDVPLKQLKTAVLVDRSHKKFPVKADYKGVSLSTSLNEMVQVKFGPNANVQLY